MCIRDRYIETTHNYERYGLAHRSEFMANGIHWMLREAAAKMCIRDSSATFVGIRIAGVPGAVVATLGCIFPALILVSVLAYLYLSLIHI